MPEHRLAARLEISPLVTFQHPPGDFQLSFDLQLTDGDADFVGASFIV